MAEIPAAFEWDKVMKIDPVNLHGCEKDQLDEVFSMFILVNVHTAHRYKLHHKCLLSCSTTNPWFCVYLDMLMATPAYTMKDYWAADLRLLFRVLQLLAQWLCQQNVPIRLFCFDCPFFLVSLLTWVTHIVSLHMHDVILPVFYYYYKLLWDWMTLHFTVFHIKPCFPCRLNNGRWRIKLQKTLYKSSKCFKPCWRYSDPSHTPSFSILSASLARSCISRSIFCV